MALCCPTWKVGNFQVITTLSSCQVNELIMMECPGAHGARSEHGSDRQDDFGGSCWRPRCWGKGWSSSSGHGVQSHSPCWTDLPANQAGGTSAVNRVPQARICAQGVDTCLPAQQPFPFILEIAVISSASETFLLRKTSSFKWVPLGQGSHR